MMFLLLLAVRFMMMSGDLVKYFFIDMATIVLHWTIEKALGGIPAVFMLLLMLHGASHKEPGKILFGIIGKVQKKH